jgi:anaerobic ribonucleoside-triphosphate reductase activating protein
VVPRASAGARRHHHLGRRAVRSAAAACRAARRACAPGAARSRTPFDILCYSGYPLRRLQRDHRDILDRLDAIVPEPFVESLPLGKIWRGSANQPLIPLSALGRERYARFVDTPAGDAAKRLQVSVEPARIWYIGIPDRDDMTRIERTCAERGLVFMKHSWR